MLLAASFAAACAPPPGMPTKMSCVLLACMLTTCASLKLEGQRIVVTGGGRGIGRAIALLCAEEGANVAILARSAAELGECAQTGASRGAQQPMLVRAGVDVTDEAAVEAAISSLAEEMGGIDVLINNAGGSCTKGPLHEQSAQAFRELLDLNVVSVLLVSSAVMRHAMLKQKRGHIINISSRAGKVGLASMGPYVASKFALEGLTATLAAEAGSASDGRIRVNSISPGMVDTRAFPKAPGRPGVRTAESIRDALLFLLGSSSGDATGTYLHVDEYDEAVAAGKPLTSLKTINEPAFTCASGA